MGTAHHHLILTMAEFDGRCPLYLLKQKTRSSRNLWVLRLKGSACRIDYRWEHSEHDQNLRAHDLNQLPTLEVGSHDVFTAGLVL